MINVNESNEFKLKPPSKIKGSFVLCIFRYMRSFILTMDPLWLPCEGLYLNTWESDTLAFFSNKFLKETFNVFAIIAYVLKDIVISCFIDVKFHQFSPTDSFLNLVNRCLIRYLIKRVYIDVINVEPRMCYSYNIKFIFMVPKNSQNFSKF